MRTAWLLVVAIGVVARLAAGQEGSAAPAGDPRIEAGTGRRVAAWPPARPFDHLSMRLEIDIPDMGRAWVSGVETLRLRANGETRRAMRPACRGPVVRGVEAGGRRCGFEQRDGGLWVDLPRPVAAGEEVTLTIWYDLDYSEGRPGVKKGEGLTYSPAAADGEGVTERSAQIHSQGQSELNSRWFPCHDFPNERLETELVVTVETGYDVVANGRLAAREDAGGGRTRWHWVQAEPHVNYLVAIAVGKFARVELGGERSARPGLEMPLFTPAGTEASAAVIYEDTARMMAFFEERFDEPYPWASYSQTILRDFTAGGMENTGATFMTLRSARGAPGSRDDLISHELAHQWMGNLLTCRGWEHIWLNEGWASLCEALWNEHEAGTIRGGGAAAGREAYLKTLRGFVRSQAGKNRGSVPEVPALASNRWPNPDDVFNGQDDVYHKGAMVLHMLKARLGEEAFWRGTRLYIDRFKAGGLVETDDFRRTLEDVSGESLGAFFDQWVWRPGVPRLAMERAWDAGAGRLTVRARQEQRVDGANPAYAFSLPVRVEMEDGAVRWLRVEVADREAMGTFELPGRPRRVEVDPGLEVFAVTRLAGAWEGDLEDAWYTQDPVMDAGGDGAGVDGE